MWRDLVSHVYLNRAIDYQTHSCVVRIEIGSKTYPPVVPADTAAKL